MWWPTGIACPTRLLEIDTENIVPGYLSSKEYPAVFRIQVLLVSGLEPYERKLTGTEIYGMSNVRFLLLVPIIICTWLYKYSYNILNANSVIFINQTLNILKC